MDDKMLKFGLFIAQRREELGLTQEEVAEKFGSTKQTVHHIEAAKVNDIKLATLLGLSSALRIDPIDLLKIYLGDNTQAYKKEPGANQVVKLAEELLAALKRQELPQ